MIALLADIHANLAALEAVLADADAQGADGVWSLGDVVGYHAQPAECIALLRARGALNILGNHDSYLAHGTDCPRSRRVSEIVRFQRGLLSEDDLAWLRMSPRQHASGGDFFVHGGPNNPTDQYLYTVSPDLLSEGVRRLFSGHTHVQTLARFSGDRWYCNPGSVGQPRDGDPRAAYALVSEDAVVLRRVTYDVKRTVASMRAAGFDSGLYENLYRGAQIGGRVDRVKVLSGEVSDESG
jgi:predicted phosphodiesterase